MPRPSPSFVSTKYIRYEQHMCSQRYARMRAFLRSCTYIYKKIRLFGPGEGSFLKKTSKKNKNFFGKTKKNSYRYHKLKTYEYTRKKKRSSPINGANC